MTRIDWVAEIQCEYGGPAIVASASDYEKWSGSIPYTLEERSTLHYWGQFTHELPSPYEQAGGHVYRECGSLDALRAARDALLAAISAKFSGARATVDEEAGEAHVLLPDNRQLWIEFSPKSQYEQACGGDTVWEHVYKTRRGLQGRAIFWDKQGSGNFVVGVARAEDELVLLRTWVDKDEFEDTARALVDAPSKHDIAAQVTLHVSDEPVVVAYSPYQWLGILGSEQLQAVAHDVKAGLSQDAGRERLLSAFRALLEPATASGAVMLDADGETDIAAAIRLLPGIYNVAVGRYDPEDDDEVVDKGEADDGSWSCIWCRLKRAG